mgnify:CR=1 FL=1
MHFAALMRATHSFRVATNQNDILYRLFTTGEYRIDEVHPSLAPSMDIQVSSNFERLLFDLFVFRDEQFHAVRRGARLGGCARHADAVFRSRA